MVLFKGRNYYALYLRERERARERERKLNYVSDIRMLNTRTSPVIIFESLGAIRHDGCFILTMR